MTMLTLDAIEFRDIRRALGVTQAEFAELLNTSQPAISQWERGVKGITGPTMKLARIMRDQETGDRRQGSGRGEQEEKKRKKPLTRGK